MLRCRRAEQKNHRPTTSAASRMATATATPAMRAMLGALPLPPADEEASVAPATPPGLSEGPGDAPAPLPPWNDAPPVLCMVGVATGEGDELCVIKLDPGDPDALAALGVELLGASTADAVRLGVTNWAEGVAVGDALEPGVIARVTDALRLGAGDDSGNEGWGDLEELTVASALIAEEPELLFEDERVADDVELPDVDGVANELSVSEALDPGDRSCVLVALQLCACDAVEDSVELAVIACDAVRDTVELGFCVTLCDALEAPDNKRLEDAVWLAINA